MPPRAIIAVRHGESDWNALRREHTSEEERYSSLLYTPDCGLTPKGMEQSRQAGHELEQYLLETFTTEEDDIQLLYVVSPLRRALQTAFYIQETCRKLASIAAPIVHPNCTEIMTDSCDIGSTPEEIQNEFHDWDFSHLTEPYWWPSGKSREETWALMQSKHPQGKENEIMIQERLEKLKEYLLSFQNDKLIIVLVCHSEVIWWLTSSKQNGKGNRHGKWTRNGEFVDITPFLLLQNSIAVENLASSSSQDFTNDDDVDQLP